MAKVVLIVEDEKVTREAFARELRSKGWDVEAAASVEDALSALRSRKTFDIMLLDKRLMTKHGAEDGSDILRIANEQGLRLPLVVVLSAYLDGDAVRRFLNLKVHAFLHKPVGVAAVAAILSGLGDGMAPLEVPGISKDEVLEAQLLVGGGTPMLVYGDMTGASFGASTHMVHGLDVAAARSEPSSIEAFVSYSHLDERLRKELDKHLSTLKRNEIMTVWHDGKIGPGREFPQEIAQHLESSPLILLLVTENFLASDYCYCKEMKVAVERHNNRQARVIPIILKPADWQDTPFGKLVALPRDGKAPALWPVRALAFLDIVQGVRRAVNELREQSSGA
ncbi:MAG: TIR domain-containing protein [Candidatus Korobacteraceae bacterium]|jgi:CheY-like chemotaxis protein